MSSVEAAQAVAAAQAALGTAKKDYEELLPLFMDAFNKTADAAANEAAIRRQLGLVNEAVNAATQKLLLTSQKAFQCEQQRILTLEANIAEHRNAAAALEAKIAEHRNAAAAFEAIISRIGWENQ